MLTPYQTVADLVLDHSECAEVFQRYRIDYCCRGTRTIEAAAKEKGIRLDTLVAELASAIVGRKRGLEGDPRELSTEKLVEHIIEVHHEYLRRTLPNLRALAAKVSRVHGGENPRLRDVETVVRELEAEFLLHLETEEKVLFPEVCSRHPNSEVLDRELRAMERDHLIVAQLLERVREATDEFVAPVGACNSYRTLFSELEQLLSQTFAHVHLENHVLRPRFLNRDQYETHY